jgi:DNA-binding IclR family transcriptional regulator
MMASPNLGETAQTLDRGLRVLEALAETAAGLTLAEIAARLGLNRTVSYRLLNTLQGHRLVSRLANGRYRLGMGIVELSRNVQTRLQDAALPVLQRLAEDLGATAHVTIADDPEAVVFLSIEPPNSPMHVVYRAGFRHPLDRGASGIALLAGRPPQPGERPEIATARAQGYAISYGEIQRGGSGVAAPICLPGTPADASLGVVVMGEIDERRAASLVQTAAQRVAEHLA